MQEKEISHIGRIISIDSHFTVVEIVSKSACSSCHAAGLCSQAESKKKLLSINTIPGQHYQVGQEVQLCLRASNASMAVVLAYVLPLFLLLSVLIILSYLKFSDLDLGLSVLIVLFTYYSILYLLRNKIAKSYNFYIKNN